MGVVPTSPSLTDRAAIDLTVPSSSADEASMPTSRVDAVRAVLVASAFGPVREAVAHCLRGAGVTAATCTPLVAVATVREQHDVVVVLVQPSGHDLPLLADAIRANPAATLIAAVGSEVSDPPVIAGFDFTVVRSLDQVLEHVAHVVHPQRAATRAMLSHRKLEILQLLARGSRPVEAAEKLDISLKTLNNHLGEVYRTLGTKNITQTVLTLLRRGVISL